MTYRTLLIAMFVVCLNIALAAESAKEPNKVTKEPALAQQPAGEVAEEAQMTEPPVLPAKDSTEYWVIRSEALTDFIPFLTKKRTEIKKKGLLLADYLVKIGKVDDFASRQIPITFDAKVYGEILQIGKAFKEMNIEAPKERPSWDALVEIAMKYVVYEGYLPPDIEEGADAAMYIEACKKREEYGQKVRKDIRTVLDQAARVWVYLDSIGELDNFKAHAVDLVLAQKEQKAQEKAMHAEAKQQDVLARAQAREERKFEDAEERASFRSSRRERGYESRQDQLLYRQSRLDERYVNSGAGYY